MSDAADARFRAGWTLDPESVTAQQQRIAAAVKQYEAEGLSTNHRDLFSLPIDAEPPAAVLPQAPPPLPPVVVAELPPPAAPPPAVQAPPDVDSMHQTALVFLDDPLARRLAVAWASCRGDDEAWFASAGLSRSDSDAVRISKALKINGICRRGGVTDPLALQYIQAIIAKPLGLSKPKGPKL